MFLFLQLFTLKYRKLYRILTCSNLTKHRKIIIFCTNSMPYSTASSRTQQLCTHIVSLRPSPLGGGTTEFVTTEGRMVSKSFEIYGNSRSGPCKGHTNIGTILIVLWYGYGIRRKVSVSHNFYLHRRANS